MKANLLFVTDHSGHHKTNSLYGLARTMRNDPRCANAWVCSKGLALNDRFFAGDAEASVFVTVIGDDFTYSAGGSSFIRNAFQIESTDVDVVLIRMPQPIDEFFFHALKEWAKEKLILNSPSGIVETSSKAFLLELAPWCAEPVLCRHMDDALSLSQKKEIVLKPFYSYGGRGLVRLSETYCWTGNDRHLARDVHSILRKEDFPMIATTFLKNVVHGDKRTLVANGLVLGSSMRFPAPGHWVCNVAQGGHAAPAEMDEDEKRLEEWLTPLLYRKGIVFYGFDTLLNDDGRRILSELNTMSPGGLVPLEEMTGRPVVTEAAGALWNYIENSMPSTLA